MHRKKDKQKNKKHTAVVIDRNRGPLQTLKLDYQIIPNNEIQLCNMIMFLMYYYKLHVEKNLKCH